MSVQRAKPYDPTKPVKGVEFFYASPKLDGIRAVYAPDKGLLSRQDKRFFGFDHIEAELKQLARKFNLSVIDGELMIAGEDFNTVQSIVMSHDVTMPEKSRVKFHVFAVNRAESFSTTLNMIAVMKYMLTEAGEFIREVEYSTVANDENAIEEACNNMVAKGYEGVMLRHPVVAYQSGKNNSLLKFKPFMEEDFTIVEFIEGTGKYEGTLGAIKVRTEIDGKLVIASVGTGFDDKFRDELWSRRVELTGKLAEIKFQEITQNKEDKSVYSLRFPVFVKLKLDR